MERIHSSLIIEKQIDLVFFFFLKGSIEIGLKFPRRDCYRSTMRFSQDIYFLLGIRGWWPWRVKIDRKIIYKVLEPILSGQSARVPLSKASCPRVLPYRKCVLPEVSCLSHNRKKERKKESNRFRYVLVGISSGGHIEHTLLSSARKDFTTDGN